MLLKRISRIPSRRSPRQCITRRVRQGHKRSAHRKPTRHLCPATECSPPRQLRLVRSPSVQRSFRLKPSALSSCCHFPSPPSLARPSGTPPILRASALPRTAKSPPPPVLLFALPLSFPFSNKKGQDLPKRKSPALLSSQ
jgi:hypothetical protein